MTVVYAEPSAVLAWLLDEPRHTDVIRALAGAGRVVTSTFTAIECGRALLRAGHAGRVNATGARTAIRMLDDAVASWHLMDLPDALAARARAAFPNEPVRTLDAIHLATALQFHDAIGPVTMLSLDERVRRNAAALGMALVPAA